MEKELPLDPLPEPTRIELGFEPSQQSPLIYLNINIFLIGLRACRKAINAKARKAEIQKLLSIPDWIEQYRDKKTGRRVLSESKNVEHAHEMHTAICLAQMNFDVVFVPDAMFQRGQKKFDVYLLRDTIILEADLKCLSSKRPDTLANRIISGSNQASRIVLDIKSDISAKDLIDGLRSGTCKNDLVKEIFLFYKNKFYILPKNLIWSKQIFNILKSEKGYT